MPVFKVLFLSFILLPFGAKAKAQEETDNTCKKELEFLEEVRDNISQPETVLTAPRIEALIKEDFDLNCKDVIAHKTLFEHVIIYLDNENEEKTYMINFLVENGADVNMRSSHYGFTPLIQAIIYEKYKSFYILMNLGADPFIKDDHGDTAIDHLREHWLTERETHDYKCRLTGCPLWGTIIMRTLK